AEHGQRCLGVGRPHQQHIDVFILLNFGFWHRMPHEGSERADNGSPVRTRVPDDFLELENSAYANLLFFVAEMVDCSCETICNPRLISLPALVLPLES